MIALVLIGLLLQCAQLVGIYLLWTNESDGAIVVPAVPDEETEEEPFLMTARPPSWKERRKQLRAAAQTKRKKLEEWRD